MTTYKVSQYNQEIGSLIISIVGTLIPVVGLYVIFNSFSEVGVQNGYGSGNFILIILVLVAIEFLFLLPKILYSWYILSYSISVTADGRIIEIQRGNQKREISMRDISALKWSYLGVAPYGPINWILRKFRGGITETASNLPNWIGVKNTFSWGTEFINPTYQNFPKYPISPDVITAIQKFRPELLVQGMEQKIADVKRQRSIPTMVLFIGVGAILLFIGIGSSIESAMYFHNLRIFNVFNILGVVAIATGYWYWKKR